MGAEQAKHITDQLNKPTVVYTPPAASAVAQAYCTEPVESKFQPVLGEVPCNNISSRETKKKLKTVKDVGQQGDVEDWVDEVIDIGAKKNKDGVNFHHVQS